jgi:hypothetical protein
MPFVHLMIVYDELGIVHLASRLLLKLDSLVLDEVLKQPLAGLR